MKDQIFSRISVIGLGYIGLPTAALFASRKIEVIGVDVNSKVVDTINRGQIHLVEPDLDILVHSVVHEGYLRATLQPAPAEAFLIAVPTPFKSEAHDPDLSYIEAAAKAIAPVLRSGNLVILESTSPVGATEQMSDWLAEARPDLTFPQDAGEHSDIRIAHCPERVLPGKVIKELVANDRIIAGMTPRCSALAVQLYRTFVIGECVITNPRTAELAKLAENSFRDVNIAFANELSLVCERFGVDVWELISLANHHPRVNILQPGPGVGGHCIAVDPWFIVSGAPAESRLIRTAREVNDGKPDWVLQQIRKTIGDALTAEPFRRPSDLRVACYGMAFKPNIDDLRESPALEIIQRLREQHPGELIVVEPNIAELPHGLQNLRLMDVDRALAHADVHVLLVAHKEFHGKTFPPRTVRAVRV
ncbi:UDP-N-acetyl-D-mannosamine dehydrogenase [Rhizobium sp. P32RR-XVIII]|uniref:UDP-N-acetyl-D-mannosamine dehydrogenase n=1 Tax=Rhizobium sp. P32RR-XVIII TaxID=2726738 RepID=UPI001456799B|nr:UDP-N-acetyl-D-mannosamine dehydrogenase [Rhizobium sp. P32RR-XVIII]NLS07855.1 UDP-N-acetyl-D-mannosamine dehydrogenase [Rhizobium sp. P32RR-XVIII]